MEVLEARCITKIYRQRKGKGRHVHALDQVSLTVNEGEMFGLLGCNGAGKTTFVRIALGTVVPEEGEIRLFGQRAESLSVKRRLGYLPEECLFPAYLTGREFLHYYGLLGLVPRAVLRRRVEECLGLLGLEHYADQKIRGYSKGLRQQLGIAQALVSKPLFIILDEPTEGLDPMARKNVRTLLKKLREEGHTILLISHLLSEIELVCDRVGILSRGRLLKTGTMKELTSDSGGYHLTVRRSSLDGLNLSAEWDVHSEQNQAIFSVSDAKTLDKLIDELRSNGIHIDAIHPLRSTLEEAFIEVVTRPGSEQ